MAALQHVQREAPDLVISDILMPKLDGFEVVELLEDDVPVVFVTAHDEHALRAFEVHAVDYLLKPFSRARLEKAIHRAQAALAEEQAFVARLRPLLESLATQGRYLTRLAVRHRRRPRPGGWNHADGRSAVRATAAVSSSTCSSKSLDSVCSLGKPNSTSGALFS